jgi:hypothetical protein
MAQNKDTQKVDLSNRCHVIIYRQNADAMVLASARLRGIPPWMSAILNIIRGGMPLGPWHQHFDNKLRLHQNHWKIIGKS